MVSHFTGTRKNTMGHNWQDTTHVFSYKHALFLAEPGKEIEIATNKITTVCLIFRQFSAWRAYKLRAYKKKNVYLCILSRTTKSNQKLMKDGTKIGKYLEKQKNPVENKNFFSEAYTNLPKTSSRPRKKVTFFFFKLWL